jgi:signal transduction histidine kinase
MKFTKYGGITIKVEIIRENNKNEKFLQISVIDTGLGIP